MRIRRGLYRLITSRMVRDEAGTTAVEYCIMLAMILMVIILSITSFGNTGATKWKNINNELNAHGV